MFGNKRSGTCDEPAARNAGVAFSALFGQNVLPFASRIGRNKRRKLPPRIIIHGNRVDTLPDSYKRYLENTFIKAFELVGTPVFLEFRGGGNPYKDRRNKLTDRQIRKRKRLKKFADRKKAKRR